MLVDVIQPALVAVENSLVGSNDLPNGLVMGFAQMQQVLAGLELIGNRILGGSRGDACGHTGVCLKLGIEFRARQDKATAYGEVFCVLRKN